MTTTEVELTAGELLNQIRGILDSGINRTTVWRWRTELGLVDGPFTLNHLQIIAAYGRFKRLGCPKTLAKERAAQWLDDQRGSYGV